jgi:hypothetical protein
MADEKEKVLLGRKVLKFSHTTDKFQRFDCVSGGPTSFVEKHYLAKEVEVPQDVAVHCVYYYEK